MRICIERDRLAEALATTSRAVSRTGSFGSAVGGVRLKSKAAVAQLVGFSPDLSVEQRIDLNEAGVDGTCVLPSRLTLEVVRSLPHGSPVTFNVTDTDAEIVSGRSRFVIRTLPAADFPEPPGVPTASAAIDTAAFAVALRQVLPATSSEGVRPLLSGVLLSAEENGLRLVATDSYRLSVRDLPGAKVLSAGQQVVVPGPALTELVRLLPSAPQATVRLGAHDAVFEIGTVRLSTRLIEGEYPNYRALLVDHQPNRLIVDKAELTGALARIKVMCASASDPVALELSDSGAVSLASAGTGELGSAGEEIEAHYHGPSMRVGLRPDFLRDALEAVETDTVVVEFGADALKPVLVHPASPDGALPQQRSLVMPTRLS